ncbi:hypothetical protein ACHAWO_006256 [Cyclotella atomus]|uniref:Uncharacterized protein n=1 Tax=Cyclotella atomus TaxID=382360 RepID=A0ABD3QUE0_9STRA
MERIDRYCWYYVMGWFLRLGAAADYIGMWVVPEFAKESYKDLSRLLLLILIVCSARMVYVVYPTGRHVFQTIWQPVQMVSLTYSAFKLWALVANAEEAMSSVLPEMLRPHYVDFRLKVQTVGKFVAVAFLLFHFSFFWGLPSAIAGGGAAALLSMVRAAHAGASWVLNLAQRITPIQLEESNGEGEEDHEDDSATESFEDSRVGGAEEEGEYNSNEDSIPHAEAVENDSSPEEVSTEMEILNEVVDDYIGAAASQPIEEQLPEVDDGKILHDNVTEYIAVTSPSKKSPEKVARSSRADSAADVTASDEVAAQIVNSATEADAQAVGEVNQNQASIGANVEATNTNQTPLSVEKPEIDQIDTRAQNSLEPLNDEIQEADEEADKSEPYSSDGGNLGEEFSEDMADDEHEPLDTEDDKRSLAEQGETFDEEEAGPSSPVHFDANEDSDVMMETDKPSILVAAAMSSQTRGSSSFPMVMTKSYRRFSLKSVDNVVAADNEINDREMAPESSALRPEPTSTKEPIDLMDSDNDAQGGALADDGYVPDVELRGEEKIEKKKVRTIEDGYVPDAEATEEESSKPIGVGNKAVKRRDVRFEAVLETREAPSFPPPPIEPATNQSTEIDDGYIPEGALTEEEKRERHERRSRSVEEGYLPDATDDDTVEKKATRSPHRKGILNEAEAIDPGHLPSAVEGTEEERTEEESQEAVASVLVATALVTQRGKLHASDIANKASLATIRIAKPKFSTQSIDDGYVPDGTFDDEEQSRLRKETRSQYVEEGYLPDGHTTPGEATDDDQPDDKPKLLLDAKIKLAESIAGQNRNRDTEKPTDTQVPPPPEPAASLSIDDGYVPSGVEEERSEEEDALTAKATHDTEEESIAIASSADVTEKHSKSDNETAAVDESKDVDDVAEMKGVISDQKSPSAKRDTDANSEPEPGTEDPSFQPITGNPLLIPAQADPPKTEPPSPEKVVTGAVAKQESPKPKRGSKREAKAKQETPTQPTPKNDGDAKSVQSQTSSVRRSSRIRTKSAAPSPKVPSSIVTGSRAGKKSAPSLPAAPENEKLDEPIDVIQEAAASGHKGTRTAASEGASTMNEGVVTVSSRTPRGKRGTDAEVAPSHASVNDESTASMSKRAKAGSTKKASSAKRKQDDDKVNGGDETKDEAPASVSSPPTKARRGRPKKDANAVDVQEDVSESVSRTQTRGRGRAKKATDDVSESVASQPSEIRSVRVKTPSQDNVSELTASPPTKTRRGRAKKNEADAVVQNDVSESVSSPPKRRGRAKKNDDVSESVVSSVRETRSTAPSEGSLASTRPRRNTRAPKRY